ncbi:uncharacterized protein [Miscanthus floridulus]|uniref:uncharacterized protein n=1 Tax=Miscanthus floridulus TaxID=154761 RepID=UPI00345ACEFA
METLPGYLQDVKPRHLGLDCDVLLLTSIAKGKSSPEWDKFSHIKQVKAYADDDDNNIQRKWYVKYTGDPFSFKTNINVSADASGDESVVGRSGENFKGQNRRRMCQCGTTEGVIKVPVCDLHGQKEPWNRHRFD